MGYFSNGKIINISVCNTFVSSMSNTGGVGAFVFNSSLANVRNFGFPKNLSASIVNSSCDNVGGIAGVLEICVITTSGVASGLVSGRYNVSKISLFFDSF